MSATCRAPCCSVTPRLSVSELFERGFRRNRATPLSIQGATCTDAAGNFARFSLDLDGDRIGNIAFNASSCATLIAYCELIAETLPRMSREIAGALTARELVDALPGVPPLKHERAVLAITAFRAALASIPITGESHHEGRLHLRNPAS
jgi:NifU-like protein involved in Fe-S cluster formation